MTELPYEPGVAAAHARLLDDVRELSQNVKNHLRVLRYRFGLPQEIIEELQAAGIELDRRKQSERRTNQVHFLGTNRRRNARRA